MWRCPDPRMGGLVHGILRLLCAENEVFSAYGSSHQPLQSQWSGLWRSRSEETATWHQRS